GIGGRFLLVAACLVVVVAGLKLAENLVVTFLVAMFLSMLAIPPMRWLQSKGVPAPLAVLMVLLGIFSLFGGVGALVGGSLNEFTTELPKYVERFEQHLENISAPIQQFLEDQNIDVTELPIAPSSILPQLLNMAGGTIAGMASFVTKFVVVLLTTVFILAEAVDFPKKLQAALATIGKQPTDLSRFEHVMHQVRDYLVIKTAMSLLTGTLVGFWVWAWGVDFPFLWGMVAFLLNYIPNLGSIIAAFPPVVLALVQPGGSLSLAVAVGLGYLAVNMVVGNFIEPRLMGQRLGLSTLVVFLSLGFWGWVWGGVGMLLSVPLTMIVKILLQNSDDLRWIAILLGSHQEAAPAQQIQKSSEGKGRPTAGKS
ncbi:MAG: AI-2E family transporter, partial [Acidobacteriota bacterium]